MTSLAKLPAVPVRKVDQLAVKKGSRLFTADRCRGGSGNSWFAWKRLAARGACRKIEKVSMPKPLSKCKEERLKEGQGEGMKGRRRGRSGKARYVWKRLAAGGACRKITIGYNAKATFQNVRRKLSPV